jgi:hypothetical protein
VLPPDKVKQVFGELSPGNDNEWHYKLRKRNGHYILRPSNDHRDLSNIHYVESFLNKWDQIADLKQEKEYDARSNENTQYFLLQVSKSGSEELLSRGSYEHINWRDNPRSQSWYGKKWRYFASLLCGSIYKIQNAIKKGI